MQYIFISTLSLLLSSTIFASPVAISHLPSGHRRLPSSLVLRASEPVDPNAVTSTTCTDSTVALNTHDTDVALLSICGGISGTIEFCGGNPSTTVGASGTSKFTLTAQNDGATINVSKGRWEHCVAAARATCSGTFSSTCIGGTTDGNFDFVLSQND